MGVIKENLFSVLFSIEILFSIPYSTEIHHWLAGYSGAIQRISSKLTNKTTKIFKKAYKIINSHARACTVFLFSILVVTTNITNSTSTSTSTSSLRLRLLRLLPTHDFLYPSVQKIGGGSLV